MVVADEQTAGRGRRGREWFSPPGSGLYVSTVLMPGRARHQPARATMLLTLSAGVALAEAVETATALRVDLKWPNDLFVVRPEACGHPGRSRWRRARRRSRSCLATASTSARWRIHRRFATVRPRSKRSRTSGRSRARVRRDPCRRGAALRRTARRTLRCYPRRVAPASAFSGWRPGDWAGTAGPVVGHHCWR